MKQLPRRKPNRLREFDYSQGGYYFVTVCTYDRKMLFGEITDGEMVLNEYGKIAANEINMLGEYYSDEEVDNYVVMPNHIHCIIVINNTDLDVSDVGGALARPNSAGGASAAPTLGNIVRGYKSGVSRKCGARVWQRNYHDRIIRNGAEYEKINEYITNNPLQWELDCHNPINPKYEEWR